MQKALDTRKKDQIINILSVGGTRTMAAEFVGCHINTITNTAKSDPQFAESLRTAEHNTEVQMLQTIARVGGHAAHAAKWALERLYPNTYGRRKPGTYSVEDIKQLLCELANRLADAAVTEEERTRSLTTMAQFGKEMILATAPFVEQAIPLHAELESLREQFDRMDSEECSVESETPAEDSDLGTFTYDTTSTPPDSILRFAQFAEPVIDASQPSDSDSPCECMEDPDPNQTILYERSASASRDTTSASAELVEPTDPSPAKEHNHAA
jgi:hypothetical protein